MFQSVGVGWLLGVVPLICRLLNGPLVVMSLGGVGCRVLGSSRFGWLLAQLVGRSLVPLVTKKKRVKGSHGRAQEGGGLREFDGWLIV